MPEQEVWFECIGDITVVGYLTIGFNDAKKAKELIEKFVKAAGEIINASECYANKIER